MQLYIFFSKIHSSAKESLHHVIGFCFMTLTYDKLSTVSLFEHGIVEKMLEFISTPGVYTSTSLRAVIHGLANIGIDCDKSKNAMGGELTFK